MRVHRGNETQKLVTFLSVFVNSLIIPGSFS